MLVEVPQEAVAIVADEPGRPFKCKSNIEFNSREHKQHLEHLINALDVYGGRWRLGLDY
jgi:hypothetical protein